MTEQKGYHYVESGLPDIYLMNGVVRTETSWGTSISIEHADELHHAIAMSIVNSPADMSKEEFRFLRIELDFSQRMLAGLLKTEEKNVQRWESAPEKGGTKTVPGMAQNMLKLLYVDRCGDEKIAELLGRLATLDRHIVEMQNRLFEFANDEWHETEAA